MNEEVGDKAIIKLAKEMDPISKSRGPFNAEVYGTYRNGEVVTFTFDNGNAHLCYGVDGSGQVFDACALTEKGAEFHSEGVLDGQELELYLSIFDRLFPKVV